MFIVVRSPCLPSAVSPLDVLAPSPVAARSEVEIVAGRTNREGARLLPVKLSLGTPRRRDFDESPN